MGGPAWRDPSMGVTQHRGNPTWEEPNMEGTQHEGNPTRGTSTWGNPSMEGPQHRGTPTQGPQHGVPQHGGTPNPERMQHGGNATQRDPNMGRPQHGGTYPKMKELTPTWRDSSQHEGLTKHNVEQEEIDLQAHILFDQIDSFYCCI